MFGLTDVDGKLLLECVVPLGKCGGWVKLDVSCAVRLCDMI